MKTFTIFVIAAFTIALTTANPTWRQEQQQQSPSQYEEDYNNNAYQTQNSENQRNQQNNDLPLNYQNTNDNEHAQRQTGYNSEYNDNRQSTAISYHQLNQRYPEEENQSQSDENEKDDLMSDNRADIAPFHTKIMRRLEESVQLSSQPEIKRKILKLANDKENACKYPGVGNKGIADRHCLGRATGHIMQLIAAFENGARDLTGPYDF